MIRNLKYNEIDFEKYNNCLHNSINYKIFAEKWYLDAVTCLPWNCLVLDDYKAIMPITFRKKFGLKYVAQPLCTQQLGVFYSEAISMEEFRQFEKNLHKRIVRSYCFNHHNTLVYKPKGVLRNNYELNLNAKYQEIHKKFRKDCKDKIKFGERHKLFLKENYNIEEVCTFHKKELAYYSLKSIDQQIIFNILKTLNSQGKLLQFELYYLNQKIGLMSIIKNKNSLQYLVSGTKKMDIKLGAACFQVNEIIKQYAEKDMVLDFLGSDIEGVEKFFRSFGPEKKPFTFYKNIKYV